MELVESGKQENDFVDVTQKYPQRTSRSSATQSTSPALEALGG